jgi:hypothetical protein
VISALSEVVKTALVKRNVDAYQVLQLIERAFDQLVDGFSDKVTVAETEKRIKELIDQLASNDAAADEALATKFGKTP